MSEDMGANNSALDYESTREKPAENVVATLYYFAGRGLADQGRWMMAACEINFTQKVIDTRAKFLKMAERQLPFGQLPLLQIDGYEIVQSQAIVRYLAKRGNMIGSNAEEELKCDMIAETVRDLISLAAGCPFQSTKGPEVRAGHLNVMKDKWQSVGSRLEAIKVANKGSNYLVGASLTYADILVTHVLTWYVEECGSEVVSEMPGLVDLQYLVMNLPGVQAFIRSQNYYPLGDAAYCEQVSTVLGRKI